MNNRSRLGWPLVITLLLMLASCTTPRTLGYLLDMEYNRDYPARPAPELVLQPEDRLSIQVLSENPQLSAPFNTLLTLKDLANQQMQQPVLTYMVDNEGNINFPVLGKLHIEGMTISEVEKMIADEIISRGYIREPVVNARIENFEVIVIGEQNTTIIPAEGKSLNLLQAIAKWGGTMGENYNIKEITVIRTENGIRRAYAVNLQKNALFESPVFYLQQNDVVYIKHKGSQMSQSSRNFISAFGTITSFISMVVSFLLLYKLN
jgi:polysaccharide export outer membrane protein